MRTVTKTFLVVLVTLFTVCCGAFKNLSQKRPCTRIKIHTKSILGLRAEQAGTKHAVQLFSGISHPSASGHKECMLTFPICTARTRSKGVPNGCTTLMMSFSVQPVSGSPVINTVPFCGRYLHFTMM